MGPVHGHTLVIFGATCGRIAEFHAGSDASGAVAARIVPRPVQVGVPQAGLDARSGSAETAVGLG